MLCKTFLPVLLAAPLALAAQYTPPRTGLVPRALQARQSCASEGYAVCDDNCMPLTGICCGYGDGEYCDLGNVCTSPHGCCPIGETCVGGGGVQTVDLPGATGGSGGSGPEPTATSGNSEPSPSPSPTTDGSGSSDPSPTTDGSGSSDPEPTTDGSGSSDPEPTSSAGSQCTGTDKSCGGSCIPFDGQCCSDVTWCPSGTSCTAEGTCANTSSSSGGSHKSSAAAPWTMDSMAIALAGLITMGFFLVR